MGIFSKKKTFVGASTVSLIEATPDIVGSTVTTAILKGRDIAPDIIGNYLNGIYVNSNRFYSYGRDSYYYGLPDGSQETLKTQDYILKPIIEKEVGFPVTLLSNMLDKCDGNSLAYPWLKEQRGWDYETNVCSTHPFTDAMGNAITAPMNFDYAEPTGVGELTLRYKYADEEGTIHYVQETSNIDNVYPGEYYHHVIYVERGKTEPRYYWNYRVNDGTYPELDVDPAIELKSPYYPVVPIRESNKDLTLDKETKLYRTSKHLLNIIGLDIEQLADGVNENPDVGDVDHAYVIMGIDILSEKKQSIRYLHDYFDYLHDLDPYTLSTYTNYLANRDESVEDTNPPPTKVITIKDANYHIELAYNYTRSDIKVGTIGAVNYCERVDKVRPVHEAAGYSADESSVIFRRQLTDTTYNEVEVFGLIHVNHIYKNYSVNTSIGDAYSKDSQGDRTNMNFVVPLNYAVVRNIGLFKANELMYDAIKMVFNSVQTVKLKWYQTGFFQFVMIIVAVAVTIITYQPGALTSSLVGGAITVGTLTLPLVLTDIIIAFAIKEGFNMVAEVLGAEIAFAAAIILACYSVGSAIGSGSNAGLPFANEALMVANNLTNSASELGMNELNIEQAEFQVEAEAKVAELEDNMEALESKHELDPLDIFTDFGDDYYFQTPTDYIYTSVHAGNIGITTLDGPRNYVETTLSLPSLSNSLGVNINV